MKRFFRNVRNVDWILIITILLIMGAGLVTNYPVDGFSAGPLFLKQLLFCLVGVCILFVGQISNYTALKGPFTSPILFFIAVGVLVSLLVFAPEINGAKSWFVVGSLAIQPVEFVKIVLIIVLARYFASRHIHIHHYSPRVDFIDYYGDTVFIGV